MDGGRFAVIVTMLLSLSLGLAAFHDNFAGASDSNPPRSLLLASIPNNPLGQIGVPLIQNVYQQIGIAVTVQEIPPARTNYMIQHGQLDGVLARLDGFEEHLPEMVKIQIPLTQLSLVAFAKVTQAANIRADRGRPFTVGLIRGLLTEVHVEGINKPVLANTSEQLMALLAHDRIDVAIDVDLAGAYYIRRDALRDIRIVSEPLQVLLAYHYIAAKHRNLVPELTRVMRDFKQQGLLDAPHEAFRAQLQIDALTLPPDQQLTPDDLRQADTARSRKNRFAPITARAEAH